MNKTKWTAFFCGDALATIFYLLAANEWTAFLIKVASTFVMGVVGGVGGLFIKDVYPWAKAKLKSYLKKKFSKKPSS